MKIAVVTGGNRGIGFAVSAALARMGMRVFMGCRDEDRGHQAASELRAAGLDVIALAMDVSEASSIEQAAQKIAKDFGTVSILINNAAVLTKGDLFQASSEDIVNGFAINLLGPLYCIRAFAPAMNRQGYGRIVNVSSAWGSFSEGLDGPAVYSISKAALNALTLTSSYALTKNVKINSICPGWVQTSMGGPHARTSPEEAAATIARLASLPDDGPSGKFFRDHQEIAW